MEIVYFGSDVFLSCFDYLVRRHHILALYTYHNEEDYFTEFAIVRRARALGIPVHYESITPERIVRYFAQEGCELPRRTVAKYRDELHIPSTTGRRQYE